MDSPPGADFILKLINATAEAREYGKVEGRHEGRVEIILNMLTMRFGTLPERVRTRIHDAAYIELDKLAERILTGEAKTLEEVMDRA